MKALVLSGGGALGAYEAGAIEGMRAAGGFDFDLVCGTSIGALNAAFVAQNKFDELATTWHTIACKGVIRLEPRARKIKDLADRLLAMGHGSIFHRVENTIAAAIDGFGIGAVTALYTMLGAIDPNPIATILAENLAFDRLARGLIVSGTNITNGASDAFWWFDRPELGAAFVERHDKGTAVALNAENFRSAVQASASIPFAFAPITIGADESASQYVDGGVANNTPIGVAIDAGADDVTSVFLNPEGQPAPRSVNTIAAVGLACFSIMQQRILTLDFANATRVNAAVASEGGGFGSAGRRKLISLREIRPATPLGITVLQFDHQALIDEVYDRGVADGNVYAAQGPVPQEQMA